MKGVCAPHVQVWGEYVEDGRSNRGKRSAGRTEEGYRMTGVLLGFLPGGGSVDRIFLE